MTMAYYTQMTGEPFSSTAIYPNRIEERNLLELETDLGEDGSPNLWFYSQRGLLVAKGYVRMVYGDHGAYLEFLNHQVLWEAWEKERSGYGYYDKWYPVDGSRLLLYDQRKTVADLPNPPAGPRSFKGGRQEGYADYRIGRCYLSPYEIRTRHAIGQ
jgi:hypothetical protein